MVEELLLNRNSNSNVELCSGKLLNFSQYYYPLEYFDEWGCISNLLDVLWKAKTIYRRCLRMMA